MIKIFLHSVFSSFLIFFLIVNLALAFNVLPRIMPVTPLVGDVNDKYFGFSSIIEFFKSGLTDDYFIVGVNNFLNRFANDIRNNLVGRWVELSNNGGIYDVESFFTAVANFFVNMFALMEIMVYVALFLISNLLILAWVIIKSLLLLGGFYTTQLPTFSYTGVTL